MRFTIPVLLSLTSFVSTVVADENGFEFFETKIRPVLANHCYQCHSQDTAEGDLRLDLKSTTRGGGGRGPAVIPENPEASVLFTAITHGDPDLRMPPKGPKLSADVIADFEKWIRIGAPDPRTELAFDTGGTWDGVQAVKDHWAYQPLAVSDPPESTGSWPLTELDQYIIDKLSVIGVKPSLDAPPRVLLRRLHFDLIGLPPLANDLDRFLSTVSNHGMDIALSREVDILLRSPHFGERWGRHWLDIARYGESSGGESNVSFPYAWRYRDYVIDAVNADVPYDRFLTEQIAGDLLPTKGNVDRARLLTATGFLAVGTKNLGENNDKKFNADLVDEQIDSLSRAVLASSIACARCHDHKFDPFTMEDYYALAGIFASTKTFFGTFTSPANNRGGEPMVLPRVEGQQIFHKSVKPAKFAELKSQYAELEAERTEIEASRGAMMMDGTPTKRFTLREVLANRWRLGSVTGKLVTLDENGTALPLAMGVLDSDVVDVPLLVRGEIDREGKVVPRAFPQAIETVDTFSIPTDQSGRRELARWLTDPSHPLTSRVFVNRVWKHLFGQGLVATVDDFGTTGGEPSHPELLDHLARRFIDDGWSLKKLVRSLVLSRTYRQASTYSETAFQLDPANVWLWRMPKRRMDAEQIRDAMLVVSGELNRSPRAGSLVAVTIGDRPISLIGLDKRLPVDLDGSVHRSVYLPIIRDRLPDVLGLFDFAEPSLVTGDREQTNVPVQALYLMNSLFVQERADAFKRRLEHETSSQEDFVNRAFEMCFARQPDGVERNRSLEFLESADEKAKQNFCQALLSTAEFRNLD